MYLVGCAALARAKGPLHIGAGPRRSLFCRLRLSSSELSTQLSATVSIRPTSTTTANSTPTMADNANGLEQLERIRRRVLSKQEKEILNVFALAICDLDSETPNAAAEAAREAARRLDALCPPLEHEKDAKDYIWAIWDIMLDVAGSPDIQDQVHHSLVSILRELKLIAKGQLNRDQVRTFIA